MLNERIKQNLSSQASDLLDRAYSEGYSDGKKNAKEEYGNSKGIAHVHRATEEQIERYGTELHGWCDCGKPIEGRWVGGINFCPWCGKIIEWEEKEDSLSCKEADDSRIDMVHMGNNIKSFRIYNHLSQRELARKANVSNSTISRIEAGQTKDITLKALDKICQVLNCEVKNLL